MPDADGNPTWTDTLFSKTGLIGLLVVVIALLVVMIVVGGDIVKTFSFGLAEGYKAPQKPVEPCGANCQQGIARKVTKALINTPNGCFGAENFTAKDVYHNAKKVETKAKRKVKEDAKREKYQKKQLHKQRVQTAKNALALAKKR